MSNAYLVTDLPLALILLISFAVSFRIVYFGSKSRFLYRLLGFTFGYALHNAANLIMFGVGITYDFYAD